MERNNRPAATIGELTEVKGIGRKTAAIILYTALGVDEGIPLDTHALRVIDRVQCCPALKNPNAIEKKLLAEFPQGARYNLHLVLTLHGRKTCQARSRAAPIVASQTAARAVYSGKKTIQQ